MDDLFGAFDGDDSASSQDQEPEPKKPRVAQDEAEQSPTTDGNKNGSEEEDAEKPKASKFASIMSQPIASHLPSSTKHASSNEPPPATVEDERDTKREIATGTSHDKSVRSYSAYPKNLPPGHELPKVEPPKEPAKTYSFELDPFQAQAVGYIDKEESVLVAAHTSAGKTAVAEYAVAKSLKQGQRVVYTSPIKALSNQKFRDLQEEFSDVGLMTGDITINPTATALVMTTEILRSMLYRGSELMREVAWVIYDEVHYMRDSERGVVWEESIILLPHRVRFVFLSATIPNASQFADWIAAIHHQPCHVVYTNYRPTPLQHYIFPSGGEGLHLVVDEKGAFREANFQQAMASLQSGNVAVAAAEAMLNSGNGKKNSKRQGGKRGNGTFYDLKRIVKLVMERNLNPVIVFSFSKKDCEKFALALKEEEYNDDVEKDLISRVYHNAIDSLSEDDQKLPQVQALLPLLKKGIGIHHGGLLPILKEIVEILFSEGLIKILFATETFAIGINMPAKTVVFTNTRKWDGKDMRWLTSGEYIQMSGRAGRRGKDDRGIVIQMFDEKMEPAVCKGILYGDPDPLNSSYRISYNMLLNLMRVEDVDPEYLLRASFHQFQREQDAPALLARAEELEREAESIQVGENDEENRLASEYYHMEHQLLLTRQSITKTIQNPDYIWKFLNISGRVLDVSIEGESYGWGVLVSSSSKRIPGTPHQQYSLDVLLNCIDRQFDKDMSKQKGAEEDAENVSLLWRGNPSTCRPVTASDRADPIKKKLITMRVFTIGLQQLQRLSAIRIFAPQNVQLPEARNKAAKSIEEVLKRFPDGIPLLDAVEDMEIKDDAFQAHLKRAEALSERMSNHTLSTEYDEATRISLIRAFENKLDIQKQAKAYRDEARGFQSMAMKDDLKRMKRVLKKLGHVDASGVIQTKGRAACEINTANELVVVEMIFGGVFNDLTPEQCVSLLSCLTFSEPTKDEGDPAQGLKSFLSNPFYKLQEIARTVVRVEVSCGLEIDEDEFVDQFNPGM